MRGTESCHVSLEQQMRKNNFTLKKKILVFIYTSFYLHVEIIQFFKNEYFDSFPQLQILHSAMLTWIS